MPVSDLKSSALRCEIVPLPCDAMLSFPGLARASSISRSKLSAGTLAEATSTFGYVAMMPGYAEMIRLVNEAFA